MFLVANFRGLHPTFHPRNHRQSQGAGSLRFPLYDKKSIPNPVASNPKSWLVDVQGSRAFPEAHPESGLVGHDNDDPTYFPAYKPTDLS